MYQQYPTATTVTSYNRTTGKRGVTATMTRPLHHSHSRYTMPDTFRIFSHLGDNLGAGIAYFYSTWRQHGDWTNITEGSCAYVNYKYHN